MATLDPSDSEVIDAYQAAGGDGTPTLADVKITIDADTTIDDTAGALVKNVTQVSLASGVTLTIENDVFDLSNDAWTTLTTITGASGADTETVAITPANGAQDIDLDLSNISTLTDIDAVTISDTDGEDTINLSSALTTSGIVTINLHGTEDTDDGNAEELGDKIFFAADASDFTKSSTDEIIKYTTVNNFETGYDRIGLYYYGYDDSGSNGIAAMGGGTKRTFGINSGDTSFNKDRTFIEDDHNTSFNALSQFDNVAGVKTQIAAGVAAYSEDEDSPVNRLMYAHYTFDSDLETNYAVINAADFTGLDNVDDVTSANSDFTVVGIAALVGVSEGGLGTEGGGLTGYNLSSSKPDEMG